MNYIFQFKETKTLFQGQPTSQNPTSAKNKIGDELMEKITNYNCDGMCSQANCDKRYTQMERVTINGIEMIVAMCDEHANQWENYSWKHSGKLGKIFPAEKHKVMLHEFV